MSVLSQLARLPRIGSRAPIALSVIASRGSDYGDMALPLGAALTPSLFAPGLVGFLNYRDKAMREYDQAREEIQWLRAQREAMDRLGDDIDAYRAGDYLP